MKKILIVILSLFCGLNSAVYALDDEPYDLDSPIPQVYFPEGMRWTYLVNANSTDTFRVIIENHNAVCYLNSDSVMSIELFQGLDDIMAEICVAYHNCSPTIYIFSDGYNSIADFWAKDRVPQRVHATRVTPIVLLDGRTAAVWAYDGDRPKDIEYIGSEKGILFPIEDYIPYITSESHFLYCSIKNQLLYVSEYLESSISEIPLNIRPTKQIVNGQLLFTTNGQTFDVLGRECK